MSYLASMANANKTKRPLVTVEKLTSGGQRGQWLCRDWQGRPILVRTTKLEALADGRATVLDYAARACLDVSSFI